MSVERRRHALPQLECALLTYNAKGGGDHAAILHLDLGEWVGGYIICGSLNQTYSSSTKYTIYIYLGLHIQSIYGIPMGWGHLASQHKYNNNKTAQRNGCGMRDAECRREQGEGRWVCVVGGGKGARLLRLTPVHLIK